MPGRSVTTLTLAYRISNTLKFSWQGEKLGGIEASAQCWVVPGQSQNGFREPRPRVRIFGFGEHLV